MIKQNVCDLNLAKLTLWNFLTSINTDKSLLCWAVVIIVVPDPISVSYYL